MKKLLTLACVAMMATAASAQITWNVKAGVGFSMFTGMSDEGETKAAFVGKFGAGLEYPLTANWSLMPSLEFANKGAKWNLSQYEWTEDYTVTYIQIPVLAAYRINLSDSWNLTLKAGPFFAYGLDGSVKTEEREYDIFNLENGESANRLDIGIDAGIDFEHHRFVFGLEYERGFVDAVPSSVADLDIYTQAFYITVGYKF